MGEPINPDSDRCTTPGSSPTGRSRPGGPSTRCSADPPHRETPIGSGAAFGALDCAEAARRLDVPTLILHATDDRVWSFDEAEELNAMVPGSRLVALPGSNHILRADEPAFAAFVEAVEQFVGG